MLRVRRRITPKPRRLSKTIWILLTSRTTHWEDDAAQQWRLGSRWLWANTMAIRNLNQVAQSWLSVVPVYSKKRAKQVTSQNGVSTCQRYNRVSWLPMVEHSTYGVRSKKSCHVFNFEFEYKFEFPNVPPSNHPAHTHFFVSLSLKQAD